MNIVSIKDIKNTLFVKYPEEYGASENAIKLTDELADNVGSFKSVSEICRKQGVSKKEILRFWLLLESSTLRDYISQKDTVQLTVTDCSRIISACLAYSGLNYFHVMRILDNIFIQLGVHYRSEVKTTETDDLFNIKPALCAAELVNGQLQQLIQLYEDILEEESEETDEEDTEEKDDDDRLTSAVLFDSISMIAEGGHPFARYFIGKQLLTTEEKDENKNRKGLEYLEYAWANGIPEAAGVLGDYYYNQNKYYSAYQYYKMSYYNVLTDKQKQRLQSYGRIKKDGIRSIVYGGIILLSMFLLMIFMPSFTGIAAGALIGEIIVTIISVLTFAAGVWASVSGFVYCFDRSWLLEILGIELFIFLLIWIMH